MHIGLVGLGKMGNNMRARLRNAGIEVTGYDANPAVSDVADLGALAQALPSPRLVWVMVPHGQITDAVTQTNVKVVAEAPAQAIASLYQVASSAAGLSLQNAVNSQQAMNQISNAVISKAVALIMQIGEKG